VDGGKEEVKNVSKQPIDDLIERQRREPEAVFKERLERLANTIEFKVPDHVPLIFWTCGHALGRYYRMSEVAFNYEILKKAIIKMVEDFPVDAYRIAPGIYSTPAVIALAIVDQYPELVSYFGSFIAIVNGPMHDILRDKYTRFPGRELSPDALMQFYGGKFMEVEEYDKLIENPAEFLLKTLVPRTAENLSDPGSVRYVVTIMKLILEMQKYKDVYMKTFMEVRAKSMPILTFGFTEVPLDFIGDFMRHPTHILTDLYRCPDKVRNATEAILPLALKLAEATTPPQSPLPPLPRMVFIPLHLNEMLPPKLYNEFYWPHLKKIIIEMYNRGIRSFVFFEGDHSPHVETLLELPKGWGIGYFERSKNFVKNIWEKLKGHTVVMGGISNALLAGGTPDKIDEYVKNLLREVGPEPGFILAPGVAEIDPTIPAANLGALINAVLKYGVYRR
jgi:hypothetical protein